jgi:hypothetical protein
MILQWLSVVNVPNGEEAKQFDLPIVFPHRWLSVTIGDMREDCRVYWFDTYSSFTKYITYYRTPIISNYGNAAWFSSIIIGY